MTHSHSAAAALQIIDSLAEQGVAPIGNDTIGTALAIFSAEILIYFSHKIHGSNIIEQHSETVMV